MIPRFYFLDKKEKSLNHQNQFNPGKDKIRYNSFPLLFLTFSFLLPSLILLHWFKFNQQNY